MSIVKNLYLIRHGKSDWDADYGLDHDRPLAPRGQRDTDKVGAYLGRASVQPDLILCSSAARTRETLDRIAAAAGWRAGVSIREDLYLAAPADVIALIASQRPDIRTLAVIGHQPFTGEVAARFLGSRHLEIPTGCVIGMEFDAASWADVTHGRGRLLMHLLPRRLD
jgi:phosphohistidine phosphatase